MIIYGKDFLKSHVLGWRRKVYSDCEDVTSSVAERSRSLGERPAEHGYPRLMI